MIKNDQFDTFQHSSGILDFLKTKHKILIYGNQN